MPRWKKASASTSPHGTTISPTSQASAGAIKKAGRVPMAVMSRPLLVPNSSGRLLRRLDLADDAGILLLRLADVAQHLVFGEFRDRHCHVRIGRGELGRQA